MITIEIMFIHQIDSTFGPSHMARYRSGGCEVSSCNVSTQLWIDLHQEIEQDIRKRGTYRTEEEIQKNTSIRFMSLYIKDVQTITQEWSGKKVIPADDLLVTNRGVMTRVGDEYVSAEYEFITKRQEKGLEDKDESRTLRAAINAVMASSDAEVYFPVHNQGSDGSDQIRFIAHWKRIGNRIKAEIINIVGNTQDKDFAEAQRMLQATIGREFVYHQDSPRAYIFTHGVDEHNVQITKPYVDKENKIHNNIQAIPEESEQRNRFSKMHYDDSMEFQGSSEAAKELRSRDPLDAVFSDTVIHVGNKVFHDTKDTVDALGAFVLRKASERTKKQKADSQTPDRQVARTVIERIHELFSKNPENRDSIKHPERLTLEKIREKPVRIGEVIRKRHQEMRQAITVLAIVADTRVGIAAIPLLIGALAKELPQQVKAVEKSIRRHERRKRRVKNRELRIMGKRKTEKKLHGRRASDRRSGEVAASQSETKRVPEPRKKKSKEQKRMRLRELVRYKERKRQTTKKKEKQTVFPERSAQKFDVVLRKTIVRLARKLEKKEKTLLPISEEVKEQRKEKIVTKFTFTWVLWLLQETNSRHSRIDNPNNNTLEQSAIILQKEPTQWILLSILWYLAMIREKKAYSVQRTAYRKKKKSKFKSNNFTLAGWQLPNQAIIFAYGS